VQTQVEELPENRVRLTVEVPSADVKHAIDHAASDLAGSLRIPGFRKGKVPMPVLLARVGKERVFAEAVESHIGGWFRNAAATSRIRPVDRPEYDYALPTSGDEDFQFTATVAVQPRPEVPDWTQLEVPAADPDVPHEVVEQELEALADAVAELAPVEGRPAQEGDTVVVDLAGDSGEGQRDYVIEVGSGRLIDEVEVAIAGMSAGETRSVEYATGEESTASVGVTVKSVLEKVRPPIDDDLARAASEFETLAGLRADIEENLREQLVEELETEFRAEAADRLVAAANLTPSGPLVDMRTAELLQGFVRSLQRRGIDPDAYLRLTGQTPEQLEQQLRERAEQAVARELVLEAVADDLSLEVTDDELRELLREQATEAGDDPDAAVEEIWASEAAREQLRYDLRLRKALDRVVAEVKRIPVELARAREKLWTPEQEKRPTDTKLWTPGSKEPV
jgi:trigger factor